MSDDEVNARLAISCGLRYHKDSYGIDCWDRISGGVVVGRDSHPPDYCDDLNATAEVRKAISARGLTAAFVQALIDAGCFVGRGLAGDFFLAIDVSAREQALAADAVLRGIDSGAPS
jgi:hypothetical protein